MNRSEDMINTMQPATDVVFDTTKNNNIELGKKLTSFFFF